MAGAGINTVKSGIQGKLDKMIARGKNPEAYINRVIFPKYQNAQRNRWKSENNTEEADGGMWARLNPTYAARKLNLYKGYEGGGTKMMIATGTLYKAVTGEDTNYFRKIISNGKIIFALQYDSKTEYFKYADELRNYSKWSRSFMKEIKHGLAVYMGKGKE
jgi:hypothetical protein